MGNFWVNGYELQNEVVLYKGRPCRVFLPPYESAEGVLYWIKYLDNEDVNIVPREDLVVLKNGKLLFGDK